MTDAAPKKILVIRSAARILNATLESLKAEYPNSRITLLAPCTWVESGEPHPLIDEVMSLKASGRMSVLNLGMKNFRILRRCKFDLAVSLYNIDHGLGYSNIDLIGWIIKPKKLRGYNARIAYQELSSSSLLKKILLEKSTLLLVVVNMLTTVILFASITLGFAGEFLFRKIFPAASKKGTV
ncbi:MAG: hypothetical protein COV66_04995 [Nitrospinae bacterium CG11_big_fil_rev_8_21_14_0_20_45_15]|nr:MAG: hypothetical protein COV66_04995 [Nitrospinae bacterium CG11_big_fil_rev_8_21_14_0_20_45_15]